MSYFGMPSVDLLGEQIDAVLSAPSTTHGLARSLRTAAWEIELHRNHHASRRVWPDSRIDQKPTKVQIGGGTHRIEDFFNIDAVPPADLLWDVREGIPLHDDTVELIFPSTSWSTSTTPAPPRTTSARLTAHSHRAARSSPASPTPPSLSASTPGR